MFFKDAELSLPGGKRGPVGGFMNGSFEMMRDECEEAETLISGGRGSSGSLFLCGLIKVDLWLSTLRILNSVVALLCIIF